MKKIIDEAWRLFVELWTWIEKNPKIGMNALALGLINTILDILNFLL